jgi:hypothetical protein
MMGMDSMCAHLARQPRVSGEECAGVKSSLVTAGLGALVVLGGGFVYLLSDRTLGSILILGGVVIALLGVAALLVQAVMDKSEKAP